MGAEEDALQDLDTTEPNVDGARRQQLIDSVSQFDRLSDTLAKQSRCQHCLDKSVCLGCLVRVFLNMKMLTAYAVFALMYLLYYFVWNYWRDVVAYISFGYLFLLVIYYIFTTQLSKLKEFLREEFRIVLIEMPQIVVTNIQDDLNQRADLVRNTMQSGIDAAQSQAEAVQQQLALLKGDLHADLHGKVDVLTSRFGHLFNKHRELTYIEDYGA